MLAGTEQQHALNLLTFVKALDEDRAKSPTPLRDKVLSRDHQADVKPATVGDLTDLQRELALNAARATVLADNPWLASLSDQDAAVAA